MRSILLLLSQKPMSTKWTGFRYFTMGSYRIMRSILLCTVTKAGPEMKKSTRSGLTLFVFHDGELQDHAQHTPAVVTKANVHEVDRLSLFHDGEIQVKTSP
jgi:hypothetical protein